MNFRRRFTFTPDQSTSPSLVSVYPAVSRYVIPVNARQFSQRMGKLNKSDPGGQWECCRTCIKVARKRKFEGDFWEQLLERVISEEKADSREKIDRGLKVIALFVERFAYIVTVCKVMVKAAISFDRVDRRIPRIWENTFDFSGWRFS